MIFGRMRLCDYCFPSLGVVSDYNGSSQTTQSARVTFVEMVACDTSTMRDAKREAVLAGGRHVNKAPWPTNNSREKKQVE